MKVPNKLKPLMNKPEIIKPHKEQLKPISSIRKGKDTLLVAPTSWGKSLVYQLTAMEHEDKTTLVIEPTLSLMHDQVNKLTRHGINAAYLDSSQSQNEAREIMDKLAKGLLNILYVTPERLSSKKFLDAIKHVDIYMVAAGRAGRDGEKAQCLLLYYPGDYNIGANLIKDSNSTETYKAAKKQLKAMHNLANSSDCITHQILDAFGEDTGHNCKRCSNCNRKRKGER